MSFISLIFHYHHLFVANPAIGRSAINESVAFFRIVPDIAQNSRISARSDERQAESAEPSQQASTGITTAIQSPLLHDFAHRRNVNEWQ